MKFSHLHVHTQYSLLDGAADISTLYKKAVKDGMPALAITDHGNMFGVFKFVAEAAKHNTADKPNTIKPIVGCEFYVVEDRFKKQFTKDVRDQRFHQLFLAKNETGYKNLVKLCSLGYIDGLYGKYPRIDKDLILKHHEGLIATTCCLGAMVPRTILRKGEEEGEKEFKWWLDIFGEDYYIELQRHEIPDQEKLNEVLLKFAAKYNVKVIASNDSHYVDQSDANAHDILLCINTGEKQSTPTVKDFADEEGGMKGKRFAFYNDQFYFKSSEEMTHLFRDIPQAIDNTNEIVGKIETLQLKKDILLPFYQIPAEFSTQDLYLRHLTFEGARKRYGDQLTPETEERINFELNVIERMGFAGYFLIVQDFINAGRDLGVFVGPGRGSAAGSVVAYCIGITNIDPIKYQLLFERFLNPERASMPDIDTDFDDEGRQKVIDYVVEKYGRNQVAQIVTYGTMAAKMSIKDVARVMDLPLPESNALAKLVPEKPGIELRRVLTAPIDGDDGLKGKEALNNDDIENVKKLRELMNGSGLSAKVLKEALVLEGSVRGTGIHAAGIIIAPMDLTEILPVATSKETELLITQFEGKVIEDAGVIKMDFLGLKTLTIIRDALQMIKENHGVQIAIDEIPLDDPKTYELYQRAETNGTFQFESAGMQKYLRELKPDRFEDLIAMNALYRPGPLEYIPNFIRRKHGQEPVAFDLPEMEEHLQETYGITVYQEQVMLLSQKLAGFTKGDADKLRKAMGKKDRKTLDQMKPKFLKGCEANGLDLGKCEKVWTDWEAFASYAFNKSHSTCYAFVAYQTAYLKAHYPGEYMAAVLTHNQSSMDKLSFFMEECKRFGVPVLGPDVNESAMDFSVNKKGEIRFGLGAIKGVGEGAVSVIIEERRKNGPFKDVFDLVERVDLRAVNKKTLENLVLAGAFDCFGLSRSQYFYPEGGMEPNGIEKAVRFGQQKQANEAMAQQSLFGGGGAATAIAAPQLPLCEPWNVIEQLKKEKEVVGMFISGHPLDLFRLEVTHFCKPVALLTDLQAVLNQEFGVGGIVTAIREGVSGSGRPYGRLTIEDYSGSSEIFLNGEDYLKNKPFFQEGLFVHVFGRVQQRFRDSNMLEFKPSRIELLETLKANRVKDLRLNLDMNHWHPNLVRSLKEVLNRYPGNAGIKVRIDDREAPVAISLSSNSLKVDICQELVNDLQQLEELGVRFSF